MTAQAIYLDNNATSHIDPVVAERMHELNLAGVSNPASQHRQGRQALHLLEEAKDQILKSIGAPRSGMRAAQVILTSGGTEANNLAIHGWLARRPGLAIVGATDHPSVIEAARLAAKPGNLRILPVDQSGLLDFQVLQQWLEQSVQDSTPISFVSAMLGNNETGVLQDLKRLCGLCASHGVPVHSDIVQAVGKIPIDMVDLGLSAVTLTAHKIHGPVGIGALVLQHDVAVEPMIVGGGQQLGLRAGTEPVVPAVGLATALTQILSALDNGEFERVARLRDSFESQLVADEQAVVIAAKAPRLPHTSNISFPGVDRQALHMALDINGLACSTGSACSSGSGRPSGSLVAMHIEEQLLQGALRFSFSRFSSDRDVESAIRIIRRALARCASTTARTQPG